MLGRGRGGGGDDVARLLDERLRRMSIGVYSALNSYALVEAGVPFARLLARDPAAAYRVLLRYTGGDRRQARLLLSRLLVGLVGGVVEVENAISALEAGDPRPLAELLGRAAGGGRRRGR